MALAVLLQKARQAPQGFAQVVFVGEEDEAEVVVVRVVEAAALHEHDARGAQHLHEELAVVGDGVHARIQPGEHVQRCLGLDAGDARYGGDELPGQIALAAQAAAFLDEVLDALVAAQRGLDGVLAGHVAAQLEVGEHVQALDVVARHAFVARNHHPAGAVAAGAVGLGQGVEGEHEHIRAEAGQGGVARAVVKNLVVHLIDQQHQALFAGDLDDAPQRFIRVERAGGVVGVDDDDAPRARRDFAAHVVQIGQPALLFIAHVVHGLAAGQADGGCPQRIVGRRHEQLIAIVEQRLRGHHDQLAGAVAQVHVLQRDARHALLLRVVHDGLAGGKQALAVGVARRIGQVADHVLLDFFGRVKAEGRHVANVQADDLLALVFHLPGGIDDGAAHVIKHVGQLG